MNAVKQDRYSELFSSPSKEISQNSFLRGLRAEILLQRSVRKVGKKSRPSLSETCKYTRLAVHSGLCTPGVIIYNDFGNLR